MVFVVSEEEGLPAVASHYSQLTTPWKGFDAQNFCHLVARTLNVHSKIEKLEVLFSVRGDDGNGCARKGKYHVKLKFYPIH